MPKKIIIDCDPGLDDAIAILLAAGNPDVEIVAVTTVAGNHTLDKVTLNARQVCTLAQPARRTRRTGRRPSPRP
ncbi:nucleoside hydrolase [Streptomyces kaempferi]